MPRRRSPHHKAGPPRHHDELLPVDPDLAPDDPAEPSATHRPTDHRHRSRNPGVLAAIALGGFLGALARYEVTLAWPTGDGRFPWATFAINTSGALFLGVVLTALLERPGRWRSARPFLCVGFTGAWTTMSSLALDADLLVKGGHPVTAVGYLLATLAAGTAASSTGIATGRRLSRRVVTA
jgi:fluoride exporter